MKLKFARLIFPDIYRKMSIPGILLHPGARIGVGVLVDILKYRVPETAQGGVAEAGRDRKQVGLS